MRTRKRKSITLEDLAAMVQRGFSDVGQRVDRFERSTNDRFNRIEHRLDRFERMILGDYERRIKRLEADIDYVKNARAIK